MMHKYYLESPIKLSQTLYELRLMPLSLSNKINFEAGQYCSFSHGEYTPRFFSFADRPAETGEVVFHVRFGGKDQQYLNDLFNADFVELKGPYGSNNQVLNHQGKILWIAEGVGIAPFRSMLRNLELNGGKNRLIDVLWFVKDDEDFKHFSEIDKNLKKISHKNKLIKIRREIFQSSEAQSSTPYGLDSALINKKLKLNQYEGVCLSGSLKLHEAFSERSESFQEKASIYSDYLDLGLVKFRPTT